MVRRPYWQEPPPLLGESEILETRSDERGTWLRLRESPFYPESGGQRADRGSVGGLCVLDVQDTDGVPWHLVELVGDAPPGPLPLRVDADLRREHSEQHSGQHLLSAVCIEILGAATLSFHMGERSSTVELDSGPLAGEGLERVEARCRELIAENRRIRVHYPDAAAAAAMPLRKPPSVSEGLRVVEIADYDWSGCGGTHLSSTGAIAAIFLGRQENIRGRVRLEFVAGSRAIVAGADALRRLRSLGDRLTCGVDELEERIASLHEQSARLSKLERLARRDRLASEAAALGVDGNWQAVGGLGALMQLDFGERDGSEVVELAGLLCGDGAPRRCLLLSWSDARGEGLLFQRTRGDGPHLGDLLRELLADSGGRGGGGADRAQGGLATGRARIAAIARERLGGK